MLFKRIAELVIGEANGKAVIIRNLRFSFAIAKDNDKTTNNLTLVIYNMSPATRSRVERVNNSVILKAGYEQDIGPVTLFTGAVVSAWTEKKDRDIITTLSVRDGILPLRDTKLSLSYNPGISALTVLKAIADCFGLPVKPLPKHIAEKSYPTGYAFVGKAEVAMQEVCRYLDLTWSIQNHEIQILDKHHPFGDELVMLTPDNGLIGIPARMVDATRNKSSGVLSTPTGMLLSESQPKTEKFQIDGYKVQCLLQPRLFPGCYVGLESDMLLLDPTIDNSPDRSRPRAYFRAETVTHSGDTHEDSWLTECQLRPI